MVLDAEAARNIVICFLSSQLARAGGKCLGFVVMPDHVHSAIWFPDDGHISQFMQQWKRRTSMELKEHLKKDRPNYARSFDISGPIWQPKYYDFNIHSERMLVEKLEYMHNNPVKAGLVERAEQWRWSSARWYMEGKPVGVTAGW